MREILFKAKRIDNGEWAEGYYFKANHHWHEHGMHEDWIAVNAIQNGGWCNVCSKYAIDVNTLCQYTGLTDKNGNKIWENALVEFEDIGEEGYEYKEGFDFTNRAKVEFAEARWSLTDFVEENSGVVDEMYDHADFKDFWQYCEVIGNIFDNPELLQ